MTDKIEGVAKALYYQYCRGRGWTEDKWECEPDEVKEQYLVEARQLFEPEPDESRLLMLIEIAKLLENKYGNFIRYGSLMPDKWEYYLNDAQELLIKTASIKDAECHKRIQAVEETLQNLHSEAQEKWADDIIRLEEKKDAECQERVERILKEIREQWKPQHHNLCYGVIDPHPDCICCKFQALKKQEGIDANNKEEQPL